MKSIIEYFCPLCIAPIVNAIGGETGNASFRKDAKKDKDETNHTTRNFIIGIIFAVVVIVAIVMFSYYNNRAPSFSPTFSTPPVPISSCGCGA